MIRVAAVAALLVLLAACDETAQAGTPDAGINRIERENMGFGRGVTVIIDEKRDVTCWVYAEDKAGGISCIPNWQLVHDGEHPEVAQ